MGNFHRYRVKYLCRCPVTKCLVGTLGVVETEIATDPDLGIFSILICFQIHFFVLHCPPQPFYEEIVTISPFPIHADSHSMSLKETSECFAGELGALVGIEDFRSAFLESPLQCLDTEAGVHGVG